MFKYGFNSLFEGSSFHTKIQEHHSSKIISSIICNMKSPIILPLLSAFAAADSIGFGHLPSNFQTSSNPNATGSATLSAIDNYSPPSSPKTINWETTINITEQFPGNGHNNIRVTSSVISFVPPYNPFTGDSNWDTCAVVFMNVSRDATVKGQDDDGTCTRTLGEGCVTAFKQYLTAQRLAAIGTNHTGFCGGMQINDLPDACQGVMGLDISAGGMMPVFDGNESQLMEE